MDKDRIAGAAHRAKGAIEEAAGNVTADTKIKGEGAAEALSDQINDLAGPGLGRVTAQVRDPPLSVVLVALGIGLIGGYLLKR